MADKWETERRQVEEWMEIRERESGRQRGCSHNYVLTGTWEWGGGAGFGNTEWWEGGEYQCTRCGDGMSRPYKRFIGRTKN